MTKINKILITIFRSFATPVFTFLLSLVGIRVYGKGFWGEFIYVFTWILLVAIITNFGNKDFLVRKYSENPAKIPLYFTRSITSRMVLLLLSGFLFFVFPFKISIISSLLLLCIFVYQSFDSLVIYHQLFLTQLIVEIIGFIILISGFFYVEIFNLETVLLMYSLSFLVKIIILAITLKDNFIYKNIIFSLKELKISFPFFLIIFSGFLASKIDLYIVNIFMDNTNISEYQIGITSFLLLQSLAYILILPFNKHLYRANNLVVKKIKKNLAILSTPIVGIGTLFIWLILEKGVNLNLAKTFYILGFLLSLPIYYFIVDIMILYRNKKEYKILNINLLGALVNLILSYYLIPFYGIIGALVSVFITQLVLLITYKSQVKL